MGLMKALAALFSKKDTELVYKPFPSEDRDISEPVLMMLKSMREHPHRWRFQLAIVHIGPDNAYLTGPRIIRHRVGYCREYNVQLALVVKDRGTGEEFHAAITIKEATMKRLADGRKLLPDEYTLTDLVTAPHAYYPEWLTPSEANALHEALSKIVYERVMKVQGYFNRESVKAAEKAVAEAERKNKQERDRLVAIYGEKQ